MKIEDIKISVKYGDIFDSPIVGSWAYICEKYGLNEWCINEGLADKNDKIEINLMDAKQIGLIDSI